eukprot:TRINITY_DN49265_c0_g1_i1.p1 TRINITY_DN49265_c0_g1~~TRINITY_DN49265_c0_g1_i1.p1  ORF type:complete len:615 (+),score=101.75 TRINITY_DN49265_c0_g1_i1:213-2057(+)
MDGVAADAAQLADVSGVTPLLEAAALSWATTEWLQVVLTTCALALILAAVLGLAPTPWNAVVGGGPPTVRLRKEQRSSRQLRLPKRAVGRQMRQRPSARLLSRILHHGKTIPWDDLYLVPEAITGKDCRPLLVFVNSRSGGGQGADVLRELRGLLHWVQAVDLQLEGPESALRWWSRTHLKYRILVAGGDGTVGWILAMLQKLQLDYMPPVAILPLGTGNDLSRVMGWGGGYDGSVAAHLLRVSNAHAAMLDRWQVCCRDIMPLEQQPETSAEVSAPTASHVASPSVSAPASPQATSPGAPHEAETAAAADAVVVVASAPEAGSAEASSPIRQPVQLEQPLAAVPAQLVQRERKELVMCNYFGIGVDAAVALDFHQMRERSPHLFFSRLVNKLWYLQSGTQNFFHQSCSNLASRVVLECDGRVVEVPKNMQGIVVLNIPSFGGGSDLWGSADGEDTSDEDEDEIQAIGSGSDGAASFGLSMSKASMRDMRLEVVGVHGSFQLGAAQVGLYSARRLAQASHVKITNNTALPVQVDGEPWLFAKGGEIEITWKSQALMLAHSAPGAHAVATDVVEWALQNNVINTEARVRMMQEIARRASLQSRSSVDPSGLDFIH